MEASLSPPWTHTTASREGHDPNLNTPHARYAHGTPLVVDARYAPRQSCANALCSLFVVLTVLRPLLFCHAPSWLLALAPRYSAGLLLAFARLSRPWVREPEARVLQSADVSENHQNRVKLVCHHSSWIALHMASSPPRYHSVLRQLLGFDGAFDFDFGFDLVLLFATSLMLCAWMSLPPLVTHLPVITLCPPQSQPLCHPSASPPPHHHPPRVSSPHHLSPYVCLQVTRTVPRRPVPESLCRV